MAVGRRRMVAVRPLKLTTWKCGRVERAILEAIMGYLRRHPRAEWVPVEAIMAELRGRAKPSEVREAMRRLAKRRILEARYG